MILSEVPWAPLPQRREWPPIMKSLRKGNLKYLATLSTTAPSQFLEEQFYDLSDDPQERVDLSSKSPIEVQALRRWLQAHVAEAKNLRAGQKRDDDEVILDEDAEERLKSLGYVGN